MAENKFKIDLFQKLKGKRNLQNWHIQLIELTDNSRWKNTYFPILNVFY